MLVPFLLLTALGCGGPDYALSPLMDDLPQDLSVESWTVQVPDDDGSAFELHRDPVTSSSQETFSFGGDAPSPMVDFLFVVDDSASMQRVLDRVRTGFRTLVREGAFPTRSRIAVMSTTPADYATLENLHPAVKRHRGLQWHPGFMGLVDGERLGLFQERAELKVAMRMPESGCDAWFAPTDVNARGVPCLEVHTQLSLLAVQVEAGLNAFQQFLFRNEGRPVFRPGAAVNVIFVSDTQDPGFLPSHYPGHQADFDELVANRPDFDTLDALVSEDNVVSSFRVHAIAPRTECSEQWGVDEPAYVQVADASGGVVIDICTATDYTPLLNDIVHVGATRLIPAFALSQNATEVDAVQVDGSDVRFHLEADGRVVVVDDEMPYRMATVKIRYR